MEFKKISIIIYIFFVLILVPVTHSLAQSVNDSIPKNFVWGFEIAPGFSKFKSDFIEQSNRTYFDYGSDFSFSFSGGLFIQKRFQNNLMLECDLLVSFVKGEERYKAQDTYSDPFVYTYTYWYFDTQSLVKKLTYIHVPILLGYCYKKFDFLVGVQGGKNIYSNVTQEEAYACYGSQRQVCESFNGPINKNISMFDIGVIGKVLYRAKKRWLVGSQFYYEITTKNSTYQMEWNYYNVSLLFYYVITKKNH